MSLTDFIETNVDLSLIDKSTYQVLVAPNITSASNLEKDSYVLVMENVIRELNKIRDDVHWTILSPMTSSKCEIESLRFENTLQLPVEFPSYPNAMRTHFDYVNFMKALDWKKNEFKCKIAFDSNNFKIIERTSFNSFQSQSSNKIVVNSQARELIFYNNQGDIVRKIDLN